MAAAALCEMSIGSLAGSLQMYIHVPKNSSSRGCKWGVLREGSMIVCRTAGSDRSPEKVQAVLPLRWGGQLGLFLPELYPGCREVAHIWHPIPLLLGSVYLELSRQTLALGLKLVGGGSSVLTQGQSQVHNG